MQDIKTKLSKELADIEWSDLIPHAQRDNLIIVGEPLSILDVGVAIASDDVSTVQKWISQQLIHKPSSDELSIWNDRPDKKFSVLIVQPFVLAIEVI